MKIKIDKGENKKNLHIKKYKLQGYRNIKDERGFVILNQIIELLYCSDILNKKDICIIRKSKALSYYHVIRYMVERFLIFYGLLYLYNKTHKEIILTSGIVYIYFIITIVVPLKIKYTKKEIINKKNRYFLNNKNMFISIMFSFIYAILTVKYIIPYFSIEYDNSYLITHGSVIFVAIVFFATIRFFLIRENYGYSDKI